MEAGPRHQPTRVDHDLPKVLESPFLNSDHNSGVVIIRSGARVNVLDFNKENYSSAIMPPKFMGRVSLSALVGLADLLPAPAPRWLKFS
jgi:hypothetical protein